MHTLMLVLFMAVAFTASLLPIGILALWVVWTRRMNTRRSPLTTELHHFPGQYVADRAERLSERANERLLLASLIGPLVLTVWAFQHIDLRLIRFGGTEVVLIVLITIVAFGSAWSGLKLLRTRRQFLDGLAAERATAQELAPLIGKGCAIYHDIPGERFNLDHVVIGPTAVYMVETKSRQKPAGRGARNAQVKFDGNVLVFPDWRDAQMLDQARGQARWLSKYLYQKTGEGVTVEPVLALPGWFVNVTRATPDVHVINPKTHDFMANRNGKAISDAQRRRIMTALEERYRGTYISTETRERYG